MSINYVKRLSSQMRTCRENIAVINKELQRPGGGMVKAGAAIGDSGLLLCMGAFVALATGNLKSERLSHGFYSTDFIPLTVIALGMLAAPLFVKGINRMLDDMKQTDKANSLADKNHLAP